MSDARRIPTLLTATVDAGRGRRVTVVIRFSDALGAWIADGLRSGGTPATLVLMLIEEHLEAGIAKALVDAFVTARRERRPFPVGAVTVQKIALGLEGDEWTGSAGHTRWRASITVLREGHAPSSPPASGDGFLH